MFYILSHLIFPNIEQDYNKKNEITTTILYQNDSIIILKNNK